MTADKMAIEVSKLVRNGKIDSRSPTADTLLEYTITRFGSGQPIHDLEERVSRYN